MHLGREARGSRVIQKYIEHYSERAALGRWEGLSLRRAIVIPSCGEGDGTLDTLRSVPGDGGEHVLGVVVVNQPENAPDSVFTSNRLTMSSLAEAYGSPTIVGMCPPVFRFSWPQGILIVIDRFSSGLELPSKKAVGLARKIGFDLALDAYARGALRTRWIHSTDADARLPRDYFIQAEEDIQGVALVYAFEHTWDARDHLAIVIQLHEIFLRYHVLGLRYAGSPYAHHSIGSTLAVDALAYASVRGIPCRAAGEDFYLLNKLAKIGRIRLLHGSPVRLQGRSSDRTPFGTGRTVADWSAAADPRKFCRFYDPRSFEYLKSWLGSLEECAARRSADPKTLVIATAKSHPRLDPDLLLQALDAQQVWHAIEIGRASSSDPARVLRHLHANFDALRTLQFIHRLRNRDLPPVSMQVALQEAPFLPAMDGEDLDEVLRTLRHLEQSAAYPLG